MSKGGSWANLQHVCGRLLAYQYSVQTIVHAHHLWANSSLFRDFDVASVRSSKGYPAEALKLNPEKTETAETIINRAPGQDKARKAYKQHAVDLQKYGLDAELEKQLQYKLDPCVHAEVLLHEWLSRTEGGTRPSRFFRNWQYIGTSKPVCRLCQDYFSIIGTPVRFRAGHPNVYVNWRLPDIYVNKLKNKDDVKAARDKWCQMLGEMKAKVYISVIRVLEEKVSQTKAHDSNTYTERITGVKDAVGLAGWLGGLQIRGGNRP